MHAEAVARGGTPRITREYTLNITLGTAAPDGFARPVILINGRFPGPTLSANPFDPIRVRVVNGLDEPVTIHWHGFLQRGTNGADGVPGITQAPIPAGGEFNYSFVADAPGTYW